MFTVLDIIIGKILMKNSNNDKPLDNTFLDISLIGLKICRCHKTLNLKLIDVPLSLTRCRDKPPLKPEEIELRP